MFVGMDNYRLQSLGLPVHLTKSICGIGASLMAQMVKNPPAIQET